MSEETVLSNERIQKLVAENFSNIQIPEEAQSQLGGEPYDPKNLIFMGFF